jgi:hypothetical protein
LQRALDLLADFDDLRATTLRRDVTESLSRR